MNRRYKARYMQISEADQSAIEAVTPGWHWSGGYRAPDNIRRRGEGTNILGWQITSKGKETEVVVRLTNGKSVIKTLARHVVLSTDLPHAGTQVARRVSPINRHWLSSPECPGK